MRTPLLVDRMTAGVAVLLITVAPAIHAQEVDNRTIYLLANSIADDVELIREVMGRPYDDSPRLPASEVSALELFLQAQTLFRKGNQLAWEAGVAEREQSIAAPAGMISNADIFEIIEQAAAQVSFVKEALGIDTALEPMRRESGISNTGIFMTIVDINRQLNLMLDETIRPRDVFNQVALVNSFAAGIITQLSPEARHPDLPSSDTHRSPAEVYAKLLECLDIVSRVARRVDGAQVMSLSSRRNIPDDIEPGHVYDIAQILVADVATVAVQLDADGQLLEFSVPARVFPTQVYQRAGLLEQQLGLIEQLL